MTTWTRWSPAARARVIQLWPTAIGGTAIAEIIHAEHGIVVSKSAIIGIAFRAGLAHKGRRPAASLAASAAVKAARRRGPPMTPEERAEKDRLRAAKNRAKAKAAAATAPRRPVPVQDVGIPVSMRVSIVELREGSCRFIDGDPKAGPATYCGHPRASGSAWCEGHRRLCTTPASRPVSVWMPSRRAA